MGLKLGAVHIPFWRGGVGFPSNTKSLGPRPTSIPSGILIHAAIWPQQTWAENGGALSPFWGEELGRHLTQCGHGLRPTCMPSFILRSVHPFGHIDQRHRQTDRQNRQRSNSIGRTVLQTVSQIFCLIMNFCTLVLLHTQGRN